MWPVNSKLQEYGEMKPTQPKVLRNGMSPTFIYTWRKPWGRGRNFITTEMKLPSIKLYR